LALILIKDHFKSMAGHSHFKNMMHRKGRADKIRSKLFTKLSREITVSAKLGTPDPEMNPRLRAAVQAARAANMPKDNIERAIKKSQGNIDNSYEFSRYEGFGPGRTGVIIEVLTDNKNRAVSNIRTIFQKFGGTLGETGSVSYQFEQIGQIKIKKDLMNANDALELAINAGAEDCVTTDFYHEINCKKEEFNFVREKIEKKIKDLSFAGLIWNPLNKVNLDKETFTKIVNFLEQIEDDDDVQNVFTNFEVDEKLLEQSFGIIKGICAALSFPIYFVRPAKWKKHFNLIGSVKDASRTKVIEIYPTMSPKIARKKDSNKADAILIGKYFIDNYKNDSFHG